MTTQESIALNEPKLQNLRIAYGDKFELIHESDISQLLDCLLVLHIDPSLTDYTLEELLSESDCQEELSRYPQWMQHFTRTQANCSNEVQDAVWDLLEARYPSFVTADI